jgi:hypothetical protein
VPYVVGKSQQDATQTLQGAGFRVVAKPRNDPAPKGTVVSQSPRGNALPGSAVTIQVSTGIAPNPTTQPPDPGGGGGGNGGGGPGGGNGGGGGGGRGFPPVIILPPGRNGQ